MKNLIAVVALAGALLASSAMAQPPGSGTYVVTVAGADNGLAIVTLGDDGSISGFGITANSDGFNIFGNWSTWGSKTNLISGELGPDFKYAEALQFYGKLGKGTFSATWGQVGELMHLNGKLVTSNLLAKLPDFSGVWNVSGEYCFGVRDCFGLTQETVTVSTNGANYVLNDITGEVPLFEFVDSSGQTSGAFIINSQGEIYESGTFAGFPILTGKGRSNARATEIRIVGKYPGGMPYSVILTR